MKRLKYWMDITPRPGVTLRLLPEQVIGEKDAFFKDVLAYVQANPAFSYRLEDVNVLVLSLRGQPPCEPV